MDGMDKWREYAFLVHASRFGDTLEQELLTSRFSKSLWFSRHPLAIQERMGSVPNDY